MIFNSGKYGASNCGYTLRVRQFNSFKYYR